MRDHEDNCVIVCSIENIDPMGVHTGDCVTVAPQQTLPDRLYQQLRDQAIAVIRAVGVETGGSNVQFAVNPETEEILVIEMNPRVSRSSALASKATGFPIAKIAARLAVGYTLDEIPNDITQVTPASFEPTIDYVVVKWPRFAFEKFRGADPRLSTHMKSVGEVMAIGRTFQQAFAQGDAQPRARQRFRGSAAPTRRSCSSRSSAPAPSATTSCSRRCARGGDRRRCRRALRGRPLVPARAAGSSRWIRRPRSPASAATSRSTPARPSSRRERRTTTPAGSGAGRRGRARRHAESVVILGAGPNRIGQGIEFDYCCVHAAMTVRDVGPRRGDDQLQPGDGLDRLRHVRPALLRAADARGRAGGLRDRAARGRDRPVRRPDAAEARRRARRGAACRCWARASTRSTWPRTAGASARCSTSSATRPRPYATAHSVDAGARRVAAASASRCSSARATCSAAARWRSSTRPRTSRDYLDRATCPTTGAADLSSTASSRTRSRSTSTRSATARTSGSAASCSTSRRPGSTPATAPACCRRTRSGPRCSSRSASRRAGIARGLGVVGLLNVQFARPRRAPVRHRGQPARLANGPVRQQGDRPPAGQARLPGHAR